MDTETAISVVLLEDEPLIAIDIEDQLQSAGFNIVKVLSTCADALEWLQNHSPDIAILDLELRDGACEAVAHMLMDRKIPFIIHSGILPQLHDPIFLSGQWVMKPSAPEELAKAIHAALGQPASF
ncbi:response regulator [Mesorhizobium sp. AR02]|uniref:response regulator n=1 Tax=Mesorhizobium sp. AR02 TaxID=2865837 RepID=UPI00215E596B|nr:response regulator [Mesorhizobium sp. AR02]UVK54909.1 response regulator [Mesorhizobium sp. AR02]